MKDEDISLLIEGFQKKLNEIKTSLASPEIYSNPARLKTLTKESQQIEEIIALYNEYVRIKKNIQELNSIINSEKDIELKEIAQQELDLAQEKIPVLREKLLVSLLPQEENDLKDVIVEIRPAAGGDEAGLFAGEIFRAYRNYAEKKSWKFEVLDLTPGLRNGIKEAIISVSGDKVFSRFKFESGVHRVQRVPETEASGRIHTSTITVAVMPEAEEIEIELKPSDLKFDVFRSSGPGGQSVNTTDSAVRVTHIPTGISVACQIEKSQHRNKETALRILRSKLLAIKQQEEQQKITEAKRAQIGSGERSEKIRTYNFPQNRITDHRYNISIYNIQDYMDGNLDLLLDKIIAEEQKRKLEKLNFNT